MATRFRQTCRSSRRYLSLIRCGDEIQTNISDQVGDGCICEESTELIRTERERGEANLH
ncbi:unnamed protein product [Brassica napus]|uniref:(rape) hypothetical protein n=1 Tax=Brassica napus TaxID=3708 RepID=A0A816XD98_BRANA|nr:unnamed protein product [Brassica napus]